MEIGTFVTEDGDFKVETDEEQATVWERVPDPEVAGNLVWRLVRIVPRQEVPA